jgi:EAL domain-containing protein (putative c-di-GMP-specific phosphodiesterase class I)
LRHYEDPLDTLDILAEMGLRLVVEDFGSRFTQMDRLRDLPVLAVNIAGRYLSGFAQPDGPDPMDEHLVGSLVVSGRLLDLMVVADGVRTPEQAKRLDKLGVKIVKGPYAGGLASAMEIEQMIAEELGHQE